MRKPLEPSAILKDQFPNTKIHRCPPLSKERTTTEYRSTATYTRDNVAPHTAAPLTHLPYSQHFAFAPLREPSHHHRCVGRSRPTPQRPRDLEAHQLGLETLAAAAVKVLKETLAATVVLCSILHY
ncbi:hypothetical protein VNO80_07181 [Phaseolus coccineus]|uniref:Uncharacterized protein n=1 Tax=Phaseolus coccineus TaxID=3886 RepID=A0AAN9RI86_PHACN